MTEPGSHPRPTTPATEALFGLVRVDEDCWTMEVTASRGGATSSLYGGLALGAAVAALEQHSGRELVWACAHFLAGTPVGSSLTLVAELTAVGLSVAHGRVRMLVGDREVVAVTASLTRPARRPSPGWQARALPVVPGPQHCAPRVQRRPNGTVHDHWDVRVAAGRNWDELDGTASEDGIGALWIRFNSDVMITPATLAVLADMVPFAASQALGTRLRAVSLDNTIRIGNLVDAQAGTWVLVWTRIEVIDRGFAHGVVELWTESGHLLATASQSAMVRPLGH